jgi:hypothetical protein
MMMTQRTSSSFVGTPTVSSRQNSRRVNTHTSTTRAALSHDERLAKQSRIGKQPIAVPKGVTYDLKKGLLKVKVIIYGRFPIVLNVNINRGTWRYELLRARANSI